MNNPKRYLYILAARILYEDHGYIEKAKGRVIMVPVLDNAIYVDNGDMEQWAEAMADMQLLAEAKLGLKLTDHPDRTFVTNAPADSEEQITTFIGGDDGKELVDERKPDNLLDLAKPKKEPKDDSD